jgi:hypothetical protein
VIRTAIDTISERTGRSTSGVILMRLQAGDRLAAIALLEPSPNGDQPEDESESLADVPIDAEEPEVADVLSTEGTYDPDEELEEAEEPDEEE